ncbi:hypothetical protein IQ07DRAFT_247218 [Pyrenochaeta sp. DS3sAY3a]|nr:hypothetical protein IQ07DRAFT_247218 [Pyrenochaeta sp. DS3sAY3a]
MFTRQSKRIDSVANQAAIEHSTPKPRSDLSRNRRDTNSIDSDLPPMSQLAFEGRSHCSNDDHLFNNTGAGKSSTFVNTPEYLSQQEPSLNPLTPTAVTNREAGAEDTRWRNLRAYSPTPGDRTLERRRSSFLVRFGVFVASLLGYSSPGSQDKQPEIPSESSPPPSSRSPLDDPSGDSFPDYQVPAAPCGTPDSGLHPLTRLTRVIPPTSTVDLRDVKPTSRSVIEEPRGRSSAPSPSPNEHFRVGSAPIPIPNRARNLDEDSWAHANAFPIAPPSFGHGRHQRPASPVTSPLTTMQASQTYTLRRIQADLQDARSPPPSPVILPTLMSALPAAMSGTDLGPREHVSPAERKELERVEKEFERPASPSLLTPPRSSLAVPWACDLPAPPQQSAVSPPLEELMIFDMEMDTPQSTPPGASPYLSRKDARQ